MREKRHELIVTNSNTMKLRKFYTFPQLFSSLEQQDCQATFWYLPHPACTVQAKTSMPKAKADKQ